MKTAISLPDDTFERASNRAKQLGMSRSEFFARAAESYLDELDEQALTGQIDAVLDHVGHDDSTESAVEAGRIRLYTDGGDW